VAEISLIAAEAWWDFGNTPQTEEGPQGHGNQEEGEAKGFI